MLTVEFAGSRYESQKEAPDGVSDTIELWLRAAHQDGAFSYRTIDRTKGTGTMSRVHAISVRDGTFVTARIRPEGRGNTNAWVVSIPVPDGRDAEQFLRDLQVAERIVNGDEDKVLESKLAMLYTYLDGNPIEIATLDPRMATRSKFETVEYMVHELETLSERKLFVRKTGPGTFEWRKRFKKVPVASLEEEEWPPTKIELFVASLNPDERVLVRDLFSLHSRVQRNDGLVEMRLPSELPLFDEEIANFMEKAEDAGLVKPVGENPNGILGKVWSLSLPPLLMCLVDMSFMFPEDIRAHRSRSDSNGADESGTDDSWSQMTWIPPGTPGADQGLLLMTSFLDLTGCEIAEEIHDPPRVIPLNRKTEDGDDLVLEIGRTTTIRAPDHGGKTPIEPAEPMTGPIDEALVQARDQLAEEELKREAADAELAQLHSQQEELARRVSESEERGLESDATRARLKAEIAALEEQARAADIERRADELFDRFASYLETEVEKSGLPMEAVIKAFKKRVPPGFTYPDS